MAYPWTKVYYGKPDKPQAIKEEGKTPVFFAQEYHVDDAKYCVYFTPSYAFTTAEECSIEEVYNAIITEDIPLNDYEDADEAELEIQVISYYDLEEDTLVTTGIPEAGVEINDDIALRMKAIFYKFNKIESIDVEA